MGTCSSFPLYSQNHPPGYQWDISHMPTTLTSTNKKTDFILFCSSSAISLRIRVSIAYADWIGSHRSISSTHSTNPREFPPDIYEFGRIYHGFHQGKYPFPCDEVNALASTRWVIAYKYILILDHYRMRRIDMISSINCFKSRGEGYYTLNIPNSQRIGMDHVFWI